MAKAPRSIRSRFHDEPEAKLPMDWLSVGVTATHGRSGHLSKVVTLGPAGRLEHKCLQRSIVTTHDDHFRAASRS